MSTTRDIALDGNGDWQVTAGDLVLVAGQAAILQAIRIRLQFFKGEWFLDEDAGVPYFQSVLVKNPDPNLLQTIFRDAILATPGVLGLPSLTLTLDRSTRSLTVAFRASTDEGELDATVTL